MTSDPFDDEIILEDDEPKLSADEILLATTEAEANERDNDDSLVMPMPPEEPARPSPPVPPAVVAKRLPKPVPRPKPAKPSVAPPLERLTAKVQPAAIPGRPTGFITPTRPVNPNIMRRPVRSTPEQRLPDAPVVRVPPGHPFSFEYYRDNMAAAERRIAGSPTGRRLPHGIRPQPKSLLRGSDDRRDPAGRLAGAGGKARDPLNLAA